MLVTGHVKLIFVTNVATMKHRKNLSFLESWFLEVDKLIEICKMKRLH